MLGQELQKEQRKSKRYRLNNSSYAIIKQQNYSEVAQLVDISISGMSFLCINVGDWDKKPFFIDLTRADKHIECLPEETTLQKIPLHPLTYNTDNVDNQGPMNIMQKCGARFAQLTLEQKIKLNDFISRNSVCPA